MAQQLVARIKRSSKYFHQSPAGRWFDARIIAGDHYCVHGNDNQYCTSDVAFGVRLDDGKIIELN